MKKQSRSVKKRIRQNEKKRLRNMAVKSRIKTLKKKVEKFILNKEKDKAYEVLKEFVSCVDKAARKNIIHQNKANRLKSKLFIKLNSMAT